MHLNRISIAIALATLLLAGCGKDSAPNTSTNTTGEEGLPKPDAVGGSVTGMPNPGQSTPNPGQPIDLPAEGDAETVDATVPVDGASPADVNAIPQGGTPELPDPQTLPLPPPDPAPPANSSNAGNPADNPQ